MKCLLTLSIIALLAFSAVSVPNYHAPNSDSVFLNESFYSGYLNAAEGGQTFFWLFESRGTPTTDPLIVWLTGASNCGSELAVFYENGPYRFSPDGKLLVVNPYSWNNNANVLYIDQPVGVGFSEGTVYEGNEGLVAADIREAIVLFLNQFPQFEHRDFYIGGSSSTGHYIPVIAEAILNLSPPLDANLKGLLIGGGWVDPVYQLATLASFAYTNDLISIVKYQTSNAAFKVCTTLIAQGLYSQAESACLAAWVGFIGKPVSFNFLNYKETYVAPLGYNMSFAAPFLNRTDVQQALGTVGHPWVEFNTTTNSYLAQDYVTNNSDIISLLLDKGLPIIVYNGDLDVVTNWYGARDWTTNQTWFGQGDFNSSSWTSIPNYGEYKAYKNFIFYKITNAGHLASFDQPAATLDMLTRFVKGWKEEVEEPESLSLSERYFDQEFLGMSY